MATRRRTSSVYRVYLVEVQGMPNLYHIVNLNLNTWEETWRVLLSLRSADFGVIVAGTGTGPVDQTARPEWLYITRDSDPEPYLFWGNDFIDTDAQDPHVYSDVDELCRDVVLANGQPHSVQYAPMFWIRTGESWRMPTAELLAHGIRVYTSGEKLPSIALAPNQSSGLSKPLKKKGRSPKPYQWDNWFPRRRFTLRRGTDYSCTQSSMSQQVRNAAAARGLRVSVVDGEDELTVVVHQATKGADEGMGSD